MEVQKIGILRQINNIEPFHIVICEPADMGVALDTITELSFEIQKDIDTSEKRAVILICDHLSSAAMYIGRCNSVGVYLPERIERQQDVDYSGELQIQARSDVFDFVVNQVIEDFSIRAFEMEISKHISRLPIQCQGKLQKQIFPEKRKVYYRRGNRQSYRIESG